MIVLDLSILNQKGTPMFYSDVFANRPAAGVVGRIFISIDTFAFYRDTGTGWDLIGGPGTGTITGSGTATQVAFFSGASSVASDSNLYWDNTGKNLGIGTATPGAHLDVHGTGVIAQLNGTGSSNTFLEFQHAGTNKWRIGNAYQAGANYFQIYDHASSIQRLRWDNTGAAQLAGDFTFTASTTNNVATFKATQPNVTIESTGVSNPASLSFNPSANFGSVIQASNTGGYFEVKTNNITSLYIGNNQQVVVGGGPIGNSLFEVIGNADIRNSYTQGPGSFVTGLQSYTISTTPGSSAYSAGIAYVAFNGSFQNNFGGSNTLPNSIYMAGVRANAALGFTANSTISVSQGTGVNLRSISNVVSQLSIPTNGAGSTISHASGMHIYSPILAGTSPTFTNYYGLAINDSAEYSPTITNRWGIYQVGTTDKNYFAANVLIGSNTDSGEKLQVTGTAKITGATNFLNSITANRYILNGSNGNSGQIIQQGDLFSTLATNFLIQASSGNGIGFLTNGGLTFNMFINSAGSVGIGTAAPAYKFTVYNSADGTTAAFGGTQYGVRIDNGGGFSGGRSTIFGVDSTFYGSYQPLSIEASSLALNAATGGLVGIGTTTITNSRLQIKGANNTVTAYSDGLKVTSNNETVFTQYNWTGINANDTLRFATGDIERARINNVGDFSIGSAQAAANSFNFYQQYSGGNAGFNFYNSAAQIVYSFNGATGTITLSGLAGVGNRAVYSDASGTLTNSSSDISLKKNIENISYGLDSVLSLRPVFYNWIPENLGDQKEIGFIAQEVQKIIPELVGENSNGKLSLDYPKLTAVLVKAIQELKQEINSLKN